MIKYCYFRYFLFICRITLLKRLMERPVEAGRVSKTQENSTIFHFSCKWRTGENPIQMSVSDLCILRNETVWLCYFQNRIIMFGLPISTFMYLWMIYIFSGLVCLFFCSQLGGRILGIYTVNRSQIHVCRKWKRGREVSFLGKHKFDFRNSVS